MRMPKYLSLLLLPLILIPACRQGGVSKFDLGNDIARQLQTDATQIDLSENANSTWDTLVVFGPHVSRAEICWRLQLDEQQCSANHLPDNEPFDTFLVAYRLRGKLQKIGTLSSNVAAFDM